MKRKDILRKKNRRTYPASDIDRYFVDALRGMLRLAPLYTPDPLSPPVDRRQRKTSRATRLGSNAENVEMRRFYAMSHAGDGNRQIMRASVDV